MMGRRLKKHATIKQFHYKNDNEVLTPKQSEHESVMFKSQQGGLNITPSSNLNIAIAKNQLHQILRERSDRLFDETEAAAGFSKKQDYIGLSVPVLSPNRSVESILNSKSFNKEHSATAYIQVPQVEH